MNLEQFYAIKTSIPRQRLIYWIKTISITGLAQIIVQAIGFLTGILIIRLLPTQEYALYTLANTMLATIGVIGDGGITTGVLAEGGKVWQDKVELGIVLNTGLKLRRKFFLFSFFITLPFMIYLFYHHGASILVIFLLILTLIPAIYAALSDSLLEIVPKLHQDLRRLQTNQASVSVIRLLLTFVTLFFIPFSYIAILASSIPRIFGNFELRKIAKSNLDFTQSGSENVKKSILAMVKKIMPLNIYLSISGQMSIWLISIFGKTSSIAEIGAISRYSMILTIITMVFSMLFIPRFSRLQLSNKQIYTVFKKIYFLLICFLIALIGIVIILAKPLLWVLGPNYYNLSLPLILSLGGSCIYTIADILYKLVSARGVIVPPYVSIMSNIVATIAGILIFDMTNIYGVLYLHVLVTSTFFIINSFFSFERLRRNL